MMGLLAALLGALILLAAPLAAQATTVAQSDGASTSLTVTSTGTYSTGTFASTNALDLSAAPNPVDVWVTVNFSSGASPTGSAYVYGICSEDGTHYDNSDNTVYAGSALATTTMPTVVDWKGPVQIGVLSSKTATVTFSLRQLIGQSLCRKVGFAIDNETGVTAAGYPTVTYTTVNYTNN